MISTSQPNSTADLSGGRQQFHLRLSRALGLTSIRLIVTWQPFGEIMRSGTEVNGMEHVACVCQQDEQATVEVNKYLSESE